MTRSWLPALAALLGLFAVSGTAEAYCRAKACDTKPAYDDVWQEQPDPPCGRDSFGCQTEGPPLHWPQTCLSFTVQEDASPLLGIDYDTIHDVVEVAFMTWLDADCGSGARPSFAVYDYGAAECHVPQYNQTKPNANVIMFRDDGWDKEYDAFNTLALTTLSYNTETAEIYDADVEIDSKQYPFVASDDPQQGEVDLQSVVTHEIGHFLGLSHSDLKQATMWASYVDGEKQQRDLHQDDIDGICAIYPPDQPVDEHNCAPRHGFSVECQDDHADEGCAMGTPRRAGTSAALFAALVALGLLRRRRR